MGIGTAATPLAFELPALAGGTVGRLAWENHD
jgi:hypothetical protein